MLLLLSCSYLPSCFYPFAFACSNAQNQMPFYSLALVEVGKPFFSIRSAISAADISNDFTLGVPGEAFSFTQCGNKVSVADASGLSGEVAQLEQFIREHVKPWAKAFCYPCLILTIERSLGKPLNFLKGLVSKRRSDKRKHEEQAKIYFVQPNYGSFPTCICRIRSLLVRPVMTTLDEIQNINVKPKRDSWISGKLQR
ncbi:hypothetical protein DITRI_Ditri04bG0085600 [Diplodiscus trichospermus]